MGKLRLMPFVLYSFRADIAMPPRKDHDRCYPLDIGKGNHEVSVNGFRRVPGFDLSGSTDFTDYTDDPSTWT